MTDAWRDEQWKTAAKRDHPVYKTLDRVIGKVEDDNPAAERVAKAFDKVLAKYIRGFDYMDYMATGGGGTTPRLYDALVKKGVDLDKLNKDLAKMD